MSADNGYISVENEDFVSLYKKIKNIDPGKNGRTNYDFSIISKSYIVETNLKGINYIIGVFSNGQHPVFK